MSNALKRKPKKMEPKGYSKESITKMRDHARKVTRTENVIEDAFQNTKLIAYVILHDDYGFGQKRIIRLENTINTYLESIAKKELTIGHLQYYIQEKCHINTKDEVNKIPFNECFALTKYKIGVNSKQSGRMFILAASHDYMTLLGAALRSQFKFTPKQIANVYERIRDYINTLYRYKEFDIKMDDIALCLMEECKYCDERFVK